MIQKAIKRCFVVYVNEIFSIATIIKIFFPFNLYISWLQVLLNRKGYKKFLFLFKLYLLKYCSIKKYFQLKVSDFKSSQVIFLIFKFFVNQVIQIRKNFIHEKGYYLKGPFPLIQITAFDSLFWNNYTFHIKGTRIRYFHF